MDTNTEKIIVDSIEISIREIKNEINSKGFNDTGYAASSMEIRKSIDSVQLWGADYLEFLAYGRGKGGIKLKPIFEWVERKLAPILGVTDQSEIETLQYFVAKKIQETGTQVFKKQRKGIEIDKILLNLERNISSKISENIKADILLRLDKYKELFKKRTLNL